MKRVATFILLIITTSTASVGQVRVRPEASRDYRSEADSTRSQIEGEIVLPGLEREVEILRDTWGVPHIYAQTVHDLFMAQGFVATQDRLWQMEMWRRTGEGKLAEILGPTAVRRDKFARLMRYRGNMDAEWGSYAPDARAIIEAFVAGVNGNIASRKENLPFEFKLMGIAPQPWTPEVCLTRMAGYVMSRNAANEITRAQLVREIGLDATQQVWPPIPPVTLEIPRGLDLAGIDGRILADASAASGSLNLRMEQGSNNWTVSGKLTATGKPILANDPHRAITIPSLRYITHLIGPGWNVIGAGEPSLPGVAAGHNERIAFGFTIVGIDQQDIYVEELDPKNSLQYRHGGKWLPMSVVREEIPVKGRDRPEAVELHFTIHGPVLYEDRARNRAYALRWVGTEPGSAGYLPSLSLDRATTWETFLRALERWKVPSENLVYADIDGNIGWQATGLTPVRKGWSGLLPIPGTGEYEWQGYLYLAQLPRNYNPALGYIATANHNILPPGYQQALGYEWSASWRFRRIDDVLRSRKGYTVEDFQVLQNDEVSVTAHEFVSLLRETKPVSDETRDAMRRLASWDCNLNRSSSEAALYEIWVQKLLPLVWKKVLPPAAWNTLGARPSLEVVIGSLKDPTRRVFGEDPVAGRNQILLEALDAAMKDLRTRFGPNQDAWRWGSLHHAIFLHPLGRDESSRMILDRGPVPRGGDGTTVNATSAGANFRQTNGASYRQIFDLSDWDRSVAINVPGQSGEPGSPHYDDLLPLWAEGKYHPLAFSRPAVEKVTKHRLILKPKTK